MVRFFLLIPGWIVIAALAGCAPIDYTPDIFGYLEGQVTIGPICPVERPDTPCPVPSEAYAAREVVILQGQSVVARAKLSLVDGSYWIALMPGHYTVDINKSGMDHSSNLPKEIEIARGKTVRLDIEIDTGIR